MKIRSRSLLAFTVGMRIFTKKNNIAIVTGYRPFGNIHVDYDIIKDYNKKARAIIEDYSIEYEKKKDLVNDLLLDFRSEALRK